MMGRDCRYVPGWDCHGLPIEWKIEEQYRAKGQNKDDVPIIELRGECRRFAEHWIDVQREEFKRLGVTGNWDDPYLTMDFHAEAVIAEEFMKFVMNGSLYQGSKPVMWSPVEKTALAEAEVEYHDHQSPSDLGEVSRRWQSASTRTTSNDSPSVSRRLVSSSGRRRPGRSRRTAAVAYQPASPTACIEVTKRAGGNWARSGETTDPGRQACAAGASSAAKVDATVRRRRRRSEPIELQPSLRASLHGARGRPTASGTTTCRCSPATTSPTTRAPASSTPRPATATTTTSCREVRPLDR